MSKSYESQRIPEVPASPRRVRAVSAKSTTLQIFIDGTHIGGADDLQAYLARTT